MRTASPSALLSAALPVFALLGGCGKSEDPAKQAAKPAGPPQPEPAWVVADGQREWKHIVIHHSAFPTGNYASIDRFHKEIRKWDGCAYHFVIGNGRGSGDGQVEVGFRWLQQKHGAHAGKDYPDFNQHGIGICLIGDFSEKPGGGEYGKFVGGGSPIPVPMTPSPAQMESLAKLVSWLSWKYNIPRERIVGHGQIRNGDGPPRNTDCPGKHFSFAELFARMDGQTPTQIGAPAAVAAGK